MDDFWTRYLEDIAKPLAATHPGRKKSAPAPASARRRGRTPDLRLHRYVHADGREVVAVMRDVPAACGIGKPSAYAVKRGVAMSARGWRYAGVAER